MDKYVLLIILNMPFVLLGLFKAYARLSANRISRLQFLIRTFFWVAIGLCIIFARSIYDFLQTHQLTDSQPLSLVDVVLATGVIFCIFLCVRLYSKVEMLDQRLTDLHQELSIRMSERSDQVSK